MVLRVSEPQALRVGCGASMSVNEHFFIVVVMTSFMIRLIFAGSIFLLCFQCFMYPDGTSYRILPVDSMYNCQHTLRIDR